MAERRVPSGNDMEGFERGGTEADDTHRRVDADAWESVYVVGGVDEADGAGATGGNAATDGDGAAGESAADGD